MAATFSAFTKEGADVKEQPGGVGYLDADKNHPDWFLADSTGRRAGVL